MKKSYKPLVDMLLKQFVYQEWMTPDQYPAFKNNFLEKVSETEQSIELEIINYIEQGYSYAVYASHIKHRLFPIFNNEWAHPDHVAISVRLYHSAFRNQIINPVKGPKYNPEMFEVTMWD